MVAALDLSDSDLFQVLWPLLLVPVAFFFGRFADRRLDKRTPDARRLRSPGEALGVVHQVLAEAGARAEAHASANANVNITVNGGRQVAEPVEEAIKFMGALLVAVLALAALGYFFAAVREIVANLLMASAALTLGYALGALRTLRRERLLGGTWSAAVGAAMLVALLTGLAGYGLLSGALVGGRYEQALAAFDRGGRPELRPFGEWHTGVLFALQAFFAAVLAGLCVGGALVLSGLMALRVDPSGLVDRPSLAVRVLGPGPRARLALALALAVASAFTVSGWAYELTYEPIREGLDSDPPQIRELRLAGDGRPRLRGRTDELAVVDVGLERRRADGELMRVQRRRYEISKLRFQLDLRPAPAATLRPGRYVLTVRASDIAGNHRSGRELSFRVDG